MQTRLFLLEVDTSPPSMQGRSDAGADFQNTKGCPCLTHLTREEGLEYSSPLSAADLASRPILLQPFELHSKAFRGELSDTAVCELKLQMEMRRSHTAQVHIPDRFFTTINLRRTKRNEDKGVPRTHHPSCQKVKLESLRSQSITHLYIYAPIKSSSLRPS